MKMEYDITKTVEEIAMQAKENQEEFIFETIRPYCENVLQIKINKEELKQILLNGIQNQQPCEDCISREQAVYVASGYCEPQNIADELRKLPSVTPQPKRGEWIPTNDYVTTAYGSLDYYRCSCCGEDSLEEGDYCPNCGANMKEVQNDNS